jgi:tripartite-type tricarboxylate transporter receptor subunit TctC
LFSAYPSLAGAVESNKLKLLATNGLQRSAQAPDVPPIADLVPGFDFAVMVGILAKAGTPPAIVERIAVESVAAVKTPGALKQYAAAGIEQAAAMPTEFQKEISNEIERVSAAVKAARIKAE